MTPKEKAEDIFRKLYPLMENYTTPEDFANLLIDEIKNVLTELCNEKSLNKEIMYWENIRHEFKKL